MCCHSYFVFAVIQHCRRVCVPVCYSTICVSGDNVDRLFNVALFAYETTTFLSVTMTSYPVATKNVALKEMPEK